MREKGFSGIIIGVTGHCQAADIKDFERCGADAVLPKPLRFEMLTTLVNGLLAKKEREREEVDRKKGEENDEDK